MIRPSGQIYSIDKNWGTLRQQERKMRCWFPELTVHYVVADFAQPVDLPPLDGVVMANALHFTRKKDPVIQLICGYLQPRGRMILVEYNVDRGNPWVPFPLSYPKWEALALRNGFTNTRLLATRPSRFLGEIYSAVSWREERQRSEGEAYNTSYSR